MTPWHLVSDGRCPPSENMERDLSLFSSVLHGTLPKVLRIYNWDGPAITIGHHQKGFAPRDPSLSLPILRRPTGGGAVLHLDDLTFSISARESGPFSGGITGACGHVSSIFARALRACGLEAEMRGDSAAFSEVCFMRSSPVELCVGGKKALGLAMLRRKGHLLVQGVVPLRVDPGLAARAFGGCPGAAGLCDRFPGLMPEDLVDALLEAFSAEGDLVPHERRGDDRQEHQEDEGEIDVRREDPRDHRLSQERVDRD
mgnify:CR=1 FL=1